jgi:NADH dehydrogenase FAD-containing subunit
MLAALRASRRARGRAEVVLVNADDVFVERIRLHQRAVGESLRSWSISTILAGTSVRFERACVERIDRDRHVVETDRGTLAYDRLVLALGSRTHVDGVSGVRENAYTLDAAAVCPRGAHALERALASLVAPSVRRPHVVICGGGLLGVEVVTELVERFPAIRATLVTASAIGTDLSPKGEKYLRAALARRQIEVLENRPVRRVGDGMLETGEGKQLGFDVCIWTGGFVGSPLARDAGLAVNDRGQVFVDAYLRSTSDSTVYAVGDMATQSNPLGAALYMSCKCAVPTGLCAGDNTVASVLGRPQRPFKFDSSGLPISLGRADGIMDTRRNDGTLRNIPLTGRLGAWAKEAITGSPLTLFRVERWLSGRSSAPTLPSGAVHTKTPTQLGA